MDHLNWSDFIFNTLSFFLFACLGYYIGRKEKPEK